MSKKNNGKRKGAAIGLGSAAALTVAFTAMLNVNTVFAETVSEVPVVGAIAKVLTFQSFEKDENDLKISVDIPSVEMIAEEGLADSINKEILERCEQYAEEATKRAEEYREAFLATGGTEEEWAAHNIEIRVWYELKAQTEDYLSFAVMGSENWTSAYSETKYYNIDLKKGSLVTLKDVLGEDYVAVANESIQAQIAAQTEDGTMTFWTPEEGGFTTVSDETRFYMNEAGNPVIIFGKYEIAPGAAGEIEFEIQK